MGQFITSLTSFLRSKTGLALLAILGVSIFLRTFQLGSVPSGFHQDEVVNTYIGRYILENGVDVYGNAWPLLYFNKHGDFPPVIPMYISALGTYLFGSTMLGSRIVIALIGSLIVIPVYAIARKLLDNRKYALFTAFFIAIMPWHILFSRISSEGILALTFYMFGLWALLASIEARNATAKPNRIILFVLAAGSMLFTYFLYPSFRIIVPLTILPFVFIPFVKAAQTRIKPQTLLYAGIVACTVLSFALTLFISSTEWGKGRFDQTSLLRDLQAKDADIQGFIANEDSILVARIFNNKVVYLARIFVTQVLSYLSPVFLFVEGGNPPWFDIPNAGLLYLTYFLMLVPLAIPAIPKDSKGVDWRLFHYLLYLLAVAILPAALTTEHAPNTHRSILMPVILSFFVGYAFYAIRNWKIRKFPVYIALLAVLALEGVYVFHNYFQHVGMHTSIVRGDGNLQTAQFIEDQRGSVDDVYMMATGWFPIYYLYQKGDYDPSYTGQIRVGLRTDKIGNVHFLEQDCPTTDAMRLLEAEKKPGDTGIFIFNIMCPVWNNAAYERLGDLKTTDNFAIYQVYKLTMPEQGLAEPAQ